VIASRPGRATRAMDTLLMLPLGTSAVTVGFGFLVALDRWPLDLRAKTILVPIAQAVVAIPFVIRAVVPALRSIDPRLRDPAAVRCGATNAVDELDLEVGAGETVAILGPSGCGKTTLLRAIAGLQALDGGRIAWDGDDLARVPAHRRQFGLMFQEYALFPHR